MFLREEEKNIVTGILGAIAIHLLILVFALFAHIRKVEHHDSGPIEIRFDPSEAEILEKLLMERALQPESQVGDLQQEELINAVSSAESQMTRESAYEIERQIMEEEGIEDLHPDNLPETAEFSLDNEKMEKREEGEKLEPGAVKIKGNVTLEFDLGARKMIRPKIPSYKCEIAGKITVAITVNRAGKVTDAKLLSADPENNCLVKNSLEAARQTLFSVDQNASDKDQGTITYKFSAQ
ncbi:MAG: hypothetical protein JW801_00385 [Bacteroidales bacterium]|nr:hypothetical protein [Bacteroidales bacterium]